MKKSLILAFVLVFVASVGWTAPFLVCDPPLPGDVVTNYKLFFDSGAAIDHVPVAGVIRYDLAGISAGNHIVKAQACNEWGCSADSLPFTFIKKIPGAPATLKLAP